MGPYRTKTGGFEIASKFRAPIGSRMDLALGTQTGWHWATAGPPTSASARENWFHSFTVFGCAVNHTPRAG